MASAAKALQLGLRRCSAATATTATTTATKKTAMMSTNTRAMTRGAAQMMKRAQPAQQIRYLSSTASRNADEPSDADKAQATAAEKEAKMVEASEAAAAETKRGPSKMELEQQKSAVDQKLLKRIQNGEKYVPLTDASPETQKEVQRALERLDIDLDTRPPPVNFKDTLTDFWTGGMRSEDLTLSEKEDIYEDNDMTSLAHAKLDDIRERRHYMRLIAWEMPLLAKMAKPFEPPTPQMPLRFRYTSYMGEYHPAEKKVVVEFCPADLDLTPVQQNKLKKLAGARYNPEKEIVRISCESFEHQAQNKRYLGDLVQKLIATAKDPSDTFEDIPLDTRHHKFKPKPKFPKEWRMSEERKKELQAIRAEAFKIDQEKAAAGKLINGTKCIQEALAGPAEQTDVDPVAELLRVGGTSATPLRR